MYCLDFLLHKDLISNSKRGDQKPIMVQILENK